MAMPRAQHLHVDTSSNRAKEMRLHMTGAVDWTTGY